jgi:hypothetical protein
MPIPRGAGRISAFSRKCSLPALIPTQSRTILTAIATAESEVDMPICEFRELTLNEMLDDPIVRMMMKSDGVDDDDLRRLVRHTRALLRDIPSRR